MNLLTKEFFDAINKVLFGSDEEKKAAEQVLAKLDPEVWS